MLKKFDVQIGDRIEFEDLAQPEGTEHHAMAVGTVTSIYDNIFLLEYKVGKMQYPQKRCLRKLDYMLGFVRKVNEIDGKTEQGA